MGQAPADVTPVTVNSPVASTSTYLGLVQEKATQGFIAVKGTRVRPDSLRIRGSHDGRLLSLFCQGRRGHETSEGSACGATYKSLHARKLLPQ